MGLAHGLLPGRYAAVDVHYPPGGGAKAALVIATDPAFADIDAERTANLVEVPQYRPGHFFARELPALRAVLTATDQLDLLIVDGYVQLDPEGRPGLGAYAHAEFDVPVIGVAKSVFRGATHAIEVRRGAATRPLYVTAAGLAPHQAAGIVQAMAGPYRLPDALRRVDALARGAAAPLRRRHLRGSTSQG